MSSKNLTRILFFGEIVGTGKFIKEVEDMRFLSLIKQNGFFLLLLVSSFVFLHSEILASKDQNAYALEVLDNGGLTLNAEEVPLGRLMEEIHEKNGLEFRIHQSHLEHLVSASFHSLPIEDAMK